jgi:hypothetical protein
MRHRLILLLSLGLLSAQTALAQSEIPAPQSSLSEQPTPGRTHQIKLGLRDAGYAGWVPTVAYEWQVAPRVSVEVGANFNLRSYRSSYDYVDYSGDIIRTNVHHRNIGIMAFGQARYYLQPNKAPLTGWYVGAGLQGSYDVARTTQSGGNTSSSTYSRLSVQPQLRIGRQWALGKRFSLDTFVGLDYRLPSNTSTVNNGFLGNLKPAAGFQLGYRF